MSYELFAAVGKDVDDAADYVRVYARGGRDGLLEPMPRTDSVNIYCGAYSRIGCVATLFRDEPAHAHVFAVLDLVAPHHVDNINKWIFPVDEFKGIVGEELASKIFADFEG